MSWLKDFMRFPYQTFYRILKWVPCLGLFLQEVSERPGTTMYFVYAPNQWEMTLQCNIVSHWLGAYTKQSLNYSWSFKTTCCHGLSTQFIQLSMASDKSLYFAQCPSVHQTPSISGSEPNHASSWKDMNFFLICFSPWIQLSTLS